MICDESILPASVQHAMCADWKDDRNWAARLPAWEAKEELEGTLPPIPEGREPEERVAQTQQQIEQETKDGRNCHQQGKLAPEASPERICGVLEAFDGA
jgi:hypothetical protein